jgi:hypothetical protein
MSTSAEWDIHQDLEQLQSDGNGGLNSPHRSPSTSMPSRTQGSNSLLESPNLSSNTKPCTRCLRTKHRREFVNSRHPLAELDDNAWNAPNTKLSTNCRDCRNKQKVHNAKVSESRRRKSDDSKLQLVSTCSWEEFKDRYPPPYFFFSRLTFWKINRNE